MQLRLPSGNPLRSLRPRKNTSRCAVRQQTRFIAHAAAVENQEIESIEDIENNVENQSTESLYARFDKLLEQTVKDYSLGDRCVGTVESVDSKGAFIDVGSKSPAYLPLNEVSNMKIDDVAKVVSPNTEREFQVVYRNRNPRGNRHAIVVSLKQMEKDLTFKRLQQISDEKLTVTGKITGNNNGGVYVFIDGCTGFCPASHIPTNRKEEGLPALHGQKMEFHVLEADIEADRLVLSARSQSVPGSANLENYKVGDVVLATVARVMPYGAFLEVGDGVTGLLHVSQISQDHVSNAADVVSPGDKLKVMVLTQDTERGRLSLSTRKLEPNPGDMLKNPSKVFAKADEMAEEFKRILAQVEAEYGQVEPAEVPGPEKAA